MREIRCAEKGNAWKILGNRQKNVVNSSYPPRDLGKNAVHHIGMQVVGLAELYERMKASGLHIPNQIRDFGGGGGYFMLGAPDGVLIEVFEPGLSKVPEVRRYYGFDEDAT